MKRLLSRHGMVVLLVLVTSSLGGMSLAVVAFGQTSSDPDATVPTGDYTGTTPTSSYTTPTSAYTTTTSTTQTQIVPTTTTKKPTSTGQSAPVTTNGTKPSRTHTRSPSPAPQLPSRQTAPAPTRLAFTGGEPIWIGAFGIMLMITGVALHRRRRTGASRNL